MTIAQARTAVFKRFDKRALTFVGWRRFRQGPVTEERAELVGESRCHLAKSNRQKMCGC
jgi:hypothetical protein